MGSVGSVQFQIAPCSSLYLFSRSIGTLQCLVSVNYRILVYCTCHFQRSSFYLFILPFSVRKSLVISALTQGGKCGHLLRLTCSVLLWGGRNTADRDCWHVCVGVPTGYGPHWVCPHSQRRVLSGSTLLRLQGTIQAGPAFCALPRAKPLRFSGSPQGHRLSWASVLCP